MRLLIGVLALILAPTAVACRALVTPEMNAIESYASISLGEITSVIRKELEESIQNRASCSSAADRIDREQCTLPEISSEEMHVVHVKVIRRYVGSPPAIQELTIRGCGLFVPNVGDVGLFFTGGDGYTIPVYSNEGEAFTDWLLRLSVAANNSFKGKPLRGSP